MPLASIMNMSWYGGETIHSTDMSYLTIFPAAWPGCARSKTKWSSTSQSLAMLQRKWVCTDYMGLYHLYAVFWKRQCNLHGLNTAGLIKFMFLCSSRIIVHACIEVTSAEMLSFAPFWHVWVQSLRSTIPACQGLPTRSCPLNKCDASVELCQGDLMLCHNCAYSRFSQLRDPNTTNIKQRIEVKANQPEVHVVGNSNNNDATGQINTGMALYRGIWCFMVCSDV